MKIKSPFIPALAALTFGMGSAHGAITILSSATVTGQINSNTFTIPATFDPTGASKIVVLYGNRGSGGSTWGKSFNSVSYGSTVMTEAVKFRSNDVGSPEEVGAIFYLDTFTPQTTLTFSLNGQMDTQGGYTILALAGTAPGVSATAAVRTGTATVNSPTLVLGTASTSTSVNITTVSDDSLVLAVGVGDRQNLTPTSPLLGTISGNPIDGGGSNVGFGGQFVTTAGTVSPTFSMVSTVSPITLAAAFAPIPEPSSALLGGLGMLLLIRRRR